jgi:hypothetical protein
MRNLLVTAGVVFVVMVLADTVAAQRGTGQHEGVARQGVKPEVQTIIGTLKEIKTDPCEQTTGRSPIGTHVILQGEEALLNVHLGPASEVADIVGMVRVGDTLEVRAFRTPRLPENQFIAVSVKSGDNVIELRDDSLRPRWAGGGGPRAAQPAIRRGGMRFGAGGPRLANSRVLAPASQLELREDQIKAIEAILAEAEERIRDVLTEEQLNSLESQPRGGRGGRRGSR